MRIYSMTATFGKLDHAVLTLEPGLNVIEAPNEWGKSTWCAFLLAMLYGLDTRAKSTKAALADKERYAPWSGTPMAGKIDLCWQGRDITIRRSTRGRVPLGVFEAYETKSGLPVSELTAANCGEILLGVEQSVFRRAGFIRLNQMPVTPDEALGRRLNALVTTGDESGDAERLEKELRELRNRIRYNRTGLLPQAEAELAAVNEKLRELEELEQHCAKQKQRLSQGKERIRLLENHRTALDYARAEQTAKQIALAREAMEAAESQLRDMEQICSRLPGLEQAEEKLRALEQFRAKWSHSQALARQLPEPMPEPQLPSPWEGLTRDQAEEQLHRDIHRYETLTGTKPWVALLTLGGVLGVLTGVLIWRQLWPYWTISGAGSVLLLVFGLWQRQRSCKARLALEKQYGSSHPLLWEQRLQSHVQIHDRWLRERSGDSRARNELDRQLAALETERRSLCGGQSPEAVVDSWQQVAGRWKEYEGTLREARQARRYYEALQAAAVPAKAPAFADKLTHSEEETAALLQDIQLQQQRLLERIGTYRGRMEALGDPAALEAKRVSLNQRIQKLEKIYEAATLGLETLEQAKMELQRRFAPQIVRQAQQWMEELTDGRFHTLSLDARLSIRAGAGDEAALPEAFWRSDGTVDQLYLALRLAVAKALTPEAPLVLDDALVRFDDRRLRSALGILQQLAQEKQVLLFTCQSREKRILSEQE